MANEIPSNLEYCQYSHGCTWFHAVIATEIESWKGVYMFVPRKHAYDVIAKENWSNKMIKPQISDPKWNIGACCNGIPIHER